MDNRCVMRLWQERSNQDWSLRKSASLKIYPRTLSSFMTVYRQMSLARIARNSDCAQRQEPEEQRTHDVNVVSAR
ncbi:hypothetical protein HZ326_18904 [Fusarium oxysporum f. sp. albedinis]|nr:Uncharacterized protein HZ326_26121 [Fusarium oxysporum f. sp. albedinis]KAJ0138156.1 hypothetical protein HZ326_18904 [Fusarium oxysporum f. sp. albedinis]